MKNRITITITTDADRMLDALAREQMRSRGAVIEMLIKAARSGTQVCASSHLSDTAVALNAAQSDTVVAHNAAQSGTTVPQEYAQSDTPVALDARSKFDDAMLKLDSMM